MAAWYGKKVEALAKAKKDRALYTAKAIAEFERLWDQIEHAVLYFKRTSVDSLTYDRGKGIVTYIQPQSVGQAIIRKLHIYFEGDSVLAEERDGFNEQNISRSLMLRAVNGPDLLFVDANDQPYDEETAAEYLLTPFLFPEEEPWSVVLVKDIPV